jgi:hypothetical protein
MRFNSQSESRIVVAVAMMMTVLTFAGLQAIMNLPLVS